MRINNTFEIGEIVYVKTDVKQEPGVIVSMYVTLNEIMYYVSRDEFVNKYYDFELSREKDNTLKMENI
jgi:hypothetical protein